MKKSEYKEAENEDEGVAGRWDGSTQVFLGVLSL